MRAVVRRMMVRVRSRVTLSLAIYLEMCPMILTEFFKTLFMSKILSSIWFICSICSYSLLFKASVCSILPVTFYWTFYKISKFFIPY